eukprot:8591252-Pyramimonas_sp.AAC.1
MAPTTRSGRIPIQTRICVTQMIWGQLAVWRALGGHTTYIWFFRATMFSRAIMWRQVFVGRRKRQKVGFDLRTTSTRPKSSLRMAL